MIMMMLVIMIMISCYTNIVLCAQSELFQDDLFPPTLVTWSAWQEGAAWLRGGGVAPALASLQPPGMEPREYTTTHKKKKILSPPEWRWKPRGLTSINTDLDFN